MTNAAAWCVVCGGRYTSEEIEGQTACPGCKSTSVPCDPAEDVTVEINWHELRILGIWAEHHAKKHDGLNIIQAITRRLEAQYPDLPPLTLSGEVAELRKEFGEVDTVGIAPSVLTPVNGPGAVGYSEED